MAVMPLLDALPSSRGGGFSPLRWSRAVNLSLSIQASAFSLSPQISPNGYYFAIDPNGYVLLHPNLQPKVR